MESRRRQICCLWVRARAPTRSVGRLPLERIRGHGPTGRRQLRTLEIRARLPVTPLEKYGPVVQRQRLLAHNQETMVRLHPGPLRLGRQLADHLGLEPGMLWVRLPPEPLRTITNDQWPRGAAWSARLPVTQEIVGSNPIEVAEIERRTITNWR